MITFTRKYMTFSAVIKISLILIENNCQKILVPEQPPVLIIKKKKYYKILDHTRKRN